MMSNFNAQKFADFYRKKDWEGGLEGVLRYGYSESTGDDELDGILSQLDTLIQECDQRMASLFDNHDEALRPLLEEEYD